MMDSLDVSRPPTLTIDSQGDRPPPKPLTPTKSAISTNSTAHLEDNYDEKTASLTDEAAEEETQPPCTTTNSTVKNDAAPASIFNNLGKIASALPTNYLQYFTTKTTTTPPSEEHNDIVDKEDETSKDGGIEGGEPTKEGSTDASATRTWAEWANNKSVIGMGVDLASTGWKVTSETIATKTAAANAISEALEKDYLAMLHEPGTVEIDVPPRSMCRAPFLVPKGSALIWQVRVRTLDLGFAVRLRRQGLGGAVEDDIVPMKRYKAGEAIIGGRAATDYTRHIVFVFDNTYSTLRPKKCAHKVQVGPHITCEDETVLAGPDVMASPYSEEGTAAIAAQSQGQLAALSALLERAQESYVVVMERAKQAGDVGYGAMQGGIVVAAAAPLVIQRAIVASLTRKPVSDNKLAADGEVAVGVTAVDGTDNQTDQDALPALGDNDDTIHPLEVESNSDTLPVLEMSNFCALWVQLEEGSIALDCVVIPKPVLRRGVHVLASGEVTGGCQIFGYSTILSSVGDDKGTGKSYYLLLDLVITWRGPSQESAGYDDWSLKVTLRSPCPDKALSVRQDLSHGFLLSSFRIRPSFVNLFEPKGYFLFETHLIANLRLFGDDSKRLSFGVVT
eukprot:gene355-646_t